MLRPVEQGQDRWGAALTIYDDHQEPPAAWSRACGRSLERSRERRRAPLAASLWPRRGERVVWCVFAVVSALFVLWLLNAAAVAAVEQGGCYPAKAGVYTDTACTHEAGAGVKGNHEWRQLEGVSRQLHDGHKKTADERWTVETAAGVAVTCTGSDTPGEVTGFTTMEVHLHAFICKTARSGGESCQSGVAEGVIESANWTGTISAAGEHVMAHWTLPTITWMCGPTPYVLEGEVEGTYFTKEHGGTASVTNKAVSKTYIEIGSGLGEQHLTLNGEPATMTVEQELQAGQERCDQMEPEEPGCVEEREKHVVLRSL